MLKKSVIAAALGASVLLTGCITTQPRTTMQQANLAPVVMEEATIVDVHGVMVQMPAEVSSTRKYGGAAVGAVAGAALGNQIGKGNGRKIARILGGIAGGVAGAAAAEASAPQVSTPGIEAIVRRPNGELQRVIQPQPANAPAYRHGQTVRLVQSAAGVWHISPL